MESSAFKHLKVAYNLAWLEEKGIVDHLKENLAGLSSLILFGTRPVVDIKDIEMSTFDGKVKSVLISVVVIYYHKPFLYGV